VSYLWEKTEAAAVLASLYAERSPMRLVEVEDLLEAVAERERGIETEGEWQISLRWPFPKVRGRPDWLRYIFAAYARNARRHGGPHLRVDCVAAEEEGWWVIRFRDDGDGMEEEKRIHLFSPLSSLGERRQAGWGTDTVLVRAVAEAMDARPGYERRDGETVFRLTIRGERAE
jgi:signal transduction histidine kinase